MQDRFKYRVPIFNKGVFNHFCYIDFPAGYTSYSDIEGNYTGEPQLCTGLKDKDGNLIYEGDIVELVIDGKREGEQYEVFWSSPTSEYGLLGDSYSIYGHNIPRYDTYVINGYVVGSIHSNT